MRQHAKLLPFLMSKWGRKAMVVVRTAFFISLLAGLIFAQAPAKPKSTREAAPKPAAKAVPQKTVAPAGDEDIQIPPETPGSLFPAVVARINDRPILGREMERNILAQLAPLGNPEWTNLKEDYRQELVSQTLSSMIADELVYQKAVAAGMKATDAEVQDKFAGAVKSMGGDAKMNIALANRGLDRTAFRRELTRNMTVEKFIQETIGKKIVVTPAEVTGYFNDHVLDFRHPDLVRTSHILVLVQPSATPQQDSRARLLAESLLVRARKGEDFAKLARDYSMEPSASDGGDIGFLPQGSLAAEYEAAAFALPVGGISDVVRTQAGYHIIKVTGKKKEGISELEEVRSSLTEYLKNQRTNAALEKTIQSLAATAKVEVLIPLAVPLNFQRVKASSPRPQ